MIFKSPTDAIPWVGLYIVVASLICVIAMAADAIHAFWQWKLWFPSKYFTLNAFTITLIAIAMKVLVDLSIELSSNEVYFTKVVGIFFLVTMLANFIPSLGLMNDKELLANSVALGILMITIIVNILIQSSTPMGLFSTKIILLLIFPTLWPISVALIVSATRKRLEHLYKESQQLVSSNEEKSFSSKELKRYVKKYWMMTETRNPQFVIAFSSVSSAFGIICPIFALFSVLYVVNTTGYTKYIKFGNSDYKWSMKMILMVQTVGVVVGSIAPLIRFYTSIGYYNLSKKWSKNQLNVFRVEKVWIQTLQQWKDNYLHSHIPGRYGKMVFRTLKNTILNFCIIFHIVVLFICKTICLVDKAFLLLLACCWYFFKSLLKRFIKPANAPTNNMSSEIEEYTRYVVQIEEEAKLSDRILRNTLHSITQLLDESEKKEPDNLIKLLEKSKGFNGVVEFNNDQVPPLFTKEPHNCWGLVAVTLTAIAIALPNTENGHLNGLLASMREGLQIVRHIEECLNVDGNSVKAKKAARCVWEEVEVYQKWLQIDLQKKAHKGKASKEILTWLVDEATKIVIQLKGNKSLIIDELPYKFIVASSMYRISQTILLRYNELENWPNDEELFEWISTTIADILSACFTNLSRVIKMKCHHNTIEQRGDNIRNATKLLGKSKKILKILKARQLPDIDPDSMAYIDKWCALLKSQICSGDASPTSSSSPNEPFVVTVM